MTIAPAAAADLEPIRRLLDSQGLPGSDLDQRSLQTFLVQRDEGRIAGVVGLDPLGSVALLRSLVVCPERRSAGLGGELLAAAEAQALRLGFSALYLLTTDAERYFAARGYRRLERSAAPPEIKLHPQFRSLCPSTSIFMSKAMVPQHESGKQ
jgi:N-acetylglutamate synthase-like GNAT family acetyltransferase